MKIDDPVGAISVHGVAGIWGLFAVLLSNSDATDGWTALRDCQYLCVYVHCISCNLVHCKRLMGIRVSEEEEEAGVDASRWVWKHIQSLNVLRILLGLY